MKKVEIKGHIVSDDYLEVYEWFDIAATSPKVVKSIIAEAEKDGDNEILVEINSGGGSVFAGAEMYYALKKFNGTVNVEIPSLAASAAGFVAMAGDKVSISLLGQFMLHGASMMNAGNHLSMEEASEFLKNTDRTIMNAYMTKSSLTEEELRELMNKDSWLTPQQALDMGFVDEILFQQAPQAVASSNKVNLDVIPQAVLDKVKSELLAGRQPDSSFQQSVVATATEPIPNNIDRSEEPMDYEKLKNEYPELFNQVKNEGFKEGVANENSRMKAIDEIAMPGNETLVDAAKYTAPVTAEVLAMQLIKAQKEQAQTYITNAHVDAAVVAEVPPSAAPQATLTQDEQVANELINMWGGK